MPEISWTKFYNVVDGELREGTKSYQGTNPVTGEKSWDAPVATKQDLEDAVKSARKAFNTWGKTTLEERREVIRKFQAALKPHAKDFEELLMVENGKPRLFSKGECHSALDDAFSFFLDQKLPEYTLHEKDRDATITYVPLGIVGCICPWNFPLGQATLKVLPALLAGNTCILKPSPFVPYTALKLVEIAQQVMPKGLLQVVGGDDMLGPWMTMHEDIQKISFTGSVATGKKVMQACAGTLKRVTLELGGNDACIICEDVDVEKIAPEIVLGAFFNTGQVCTATKRIYIHESIYPAMVKALAKASRNLKVGGPDEEGVMIGPLQNKMQFDKVKDLYEDGKKQGYTTEWGMDVPGTGFFLRPCIVDNPPNEALIMTEEQMGPIVPCQPWTDEADVIARANDSTVGLGGTVWTKDAERAQRIANQLDTGSVFINSMPKTAIRIPFGGFKESGLGVEGGPTALLPYCNQKAYHVFHQGAGSAVHGGH